MDLPALAALALHTLMASASLLGLVLYTDVNLYKMIVFHVRLALHRRLPPPCS